MPDTRQNNARTLPRATPSPQARHRGFTLTEIMVAILLFSIVAGGMYGFMRHAQKQNALALTRQSLTNQANVIMKRLQDDFRVTASASLQVAEGSGEVKLQQHLGSKKASVVYAWQRPRLTRKVVYDGKTTIRLLSQNVDGFEVTPKPRPSIEEGDFAMTPEQVSIKVGMMTPLPGTGEPFRHDQHAMATMREVSSLKYDPHWRDVGNMKGVLSTYGNLLQSLGEDAKLLVEDISNTLQQTIADAEKAAKDALNQPKANLEATKVQVRGAIQDIIRGRFDLDAALGELAQVVKELPKDIFERKFGKPGTWLASKEDALKDVQNAFNSMQTPESISLKKLEDAAGPFKLHECFKDFVQSKKESLEQRNKLDADKTKLEDLLQQLDAKGLEAGRD
jgi:prepilin-type N-terminal cleavage/methylation domain-containing protein